MRAQLAELDRMIGTGGTDLSNGRHLGGEDLGQLTDLHVYLEERFARHLNLLRTRVDRS